MEQGHRECDDLAAHRCPLRMITMDHVWFQIGAIACSAVPVNVQKSSRYYYDFPRVQTRYPSHREPHSNIIQCWARDLSSVPDHNSIAGRLRPSHSSRRTILIGLAKVFCVDAYRRQGRLPTRIMLSLFVLNYRLTNPHASDVSDPIAPPLGDIVP